MAIKDIIGRGIGFTPASVKFIVTHGLIASIPVAATRALIVDAVTDTNTLVDSCSTPTSIEGSVT